MSTIKHPKTSIFTRAFSFALNTYKLKKKEIAEKTGIFSGRISEYALGKTDPSLENMLKIASVFNLDLVDFLALGRSGAPVPPPPPPVAVAGPPDLRDELLAAQRKIIVLLEENSELRRKLEQVETGAMVVEGAIISNSISKSAEGAPTSINSNAPGKSVAKE